MKKRIISILLTLVLLLGMLPMAALAETTDLTIQTGHAAMYTPDRYLSKIVLKDVGGTVSGSGYNWDIVLPADTDTTKALTFELTASTSSAASTGSFFWAVGAESAVSPTNVATTNPVELSVVPEWKNGHASVVVGLGSASKILVKYNIALSLEGAAEDLNDIDLGETSSKKYFLSSIYVNGATVTKRAVSDTDFSGSSSGHKATIDITLDAMPEEDLILDMTFGATGSSYITVDGGSREKFDGTYSCAVDLSKNLSCTFVTYSSSTSSTVRGTYTVYFHVEGVDNNLAPVLKDGISDKAEAEVYLPSSYTLDLNTIFADPNNDDLTYSVSIDGAEAVKAEASYTFTPEAVGTYTLVFHANDGSKTSEESYTVTVTVPKNEAPVILDGAVTTADAAQFAPWTLDLSTIFSDPDGDSLTYYAKVNNGSYITVSSSYSYVPTEAGSATLTFKASDSHLESAEHTVTLAVAATDAEYAVKVGKTVSNGSFDYIRVTDENDVGIADAALTLDGTALTVTLPRTYSASKVRAHFYLTQNGADGDIKLPFLSTKTGTAGTSSGKAINNIVSQLTTTLSSGKGSGAVYFYNTVPSTVSNPYTTYTINYAIENKVPVLTGPAEKTDDAVAGTAYTVDLSAIFSDPDGDDLTYNVSINGAAAVTADSLYAYTPTVAATDVLVFTATDGMDVSASYTLTLNVSNSSETYDVTVHVPEGVSPVFYATVGYDENGVDTFTETAPLDYEANGTTYTVKVPATVSVISFRDEVWGGMSVAVSEGQELYLEDFWGYIDHIHDGKYVTADQAIFMVKDNEGHYAVSGGAATDEELGGVTYYRFLLAATGNDATYTLIAKGAGDLADVYGETRQELFALEPDGQDFAALSLTVSNPITITVPEGAEAGLYRQINNYNTVQVNYILKDTKDGLTTYTFKNPGGSLSWRAWSEGKITKAGYLGYNEDAITVTWDDTDPAPDVQVSYSTDTAMGMRHDATAVVNVNAQNHLVLSKGGSFRLRGFRWWQIINNDVSNIMIEPDFSYTVVTGSDVISVTPSSGGNASGNRMDLTATGTGMAVVEVGFDAMEVSGMTYESNPSFLYGACDPDRTALVVVSAGEKTVDADFGIVGAGGQKAWDVEFDTVYFLGEQGSLTLTPAVSGTLSVSHDKGLTWEVLTSDNGTYTAPIISGNNILKLETADGVDYQVVRGKKLTAVVTNITDGKDATAPIAAGDTVQIELVGMHHAMSKMSAVYNPNYGGASSMNFAVERNDAVVASASGKAGQYQVLRTMTYTVPADAADGEVITLRGSSITYSNMGSGAGRHRDITDSGLGTNTSATSSNGTNCTLPTMMLTVGSSNITWEEPTFAEKIDIYGANMTLGNDLRMNFAIKTSDLQDDYVVKVTQEGKDPVVLEPVYHDATYSKVVYPIAAKEMTDTLVCEIYNADGQLISEPFSRTVRDYAMGLLNSTSQKETVKSVIVDMLNYGTEAQKTFDYNNTEDMYANALITEEQQTQYATADVEVTNNLVKGTNYVASKLTLKDSILLVLAFKSYEEGMTAKVTFTDFRGREREFDAQVTKEGSYAGVTVNQIVLGDAKCDVTVTVYKADGTFHGTAVDSVASYVARTGDSAINKAIMKLATSAAIHLG